MNNTNYTKEYAKFLQSRLNLTSKIKAVFDLSNGTAGIVLEELKNLNPNNLEIILINETPDPNFSAHGPNPLKEGAMEGLKQEVKKQNADIGIIVDADEDRVFFIDNKGDEIHPDKAAILIALEFNGPVIIDVRSGYPIREWLKENNRSVIDCRVGHYFIKKMMREKDIAFGAEVSGHYYFKDFLYADSGLRASMSMLNALSKLKEKNTSLSEWEKSSLKTYRIPETNYKVSDKQIIIEKIQNAFISEIKNSNNLDGIRIECGEGENMWWFSVRPSNTENLLRLNVEAKKEEVLKEGVKRLEGYIKN
ncbi:MAG: hypothetical protein COU07_03400 [Candidatus Harrisonbacteria bacterium CG10_big_fil_rev_8_21_14_0_10_40_38]|uniref:Phosphomannomutase/phosphoglucomutase n=1 Tax=Candidatus Harrisonbacteria bacterium CG10_big_fil_rev_8_21_14_0_10_40_38 TaxID=1974583 RepID=A0A2H0URA6_9BACT|nr:MAG: hypothetical protein COU07_03400 [Candidatus Harrisonbacteria bacterium CG10_big_fil_rev_8_21_14_0_10_40_38]